MLNLPRNSTAPSEPNFPQIFLFFKKCNLRLIDNFDEPFFSDQNSSLYGL